MRWLKPIPVRAAAAIAAAVLFQNGSQAGVPFDSAKISLAENKVFVGDLKSGRSSQHQAGTGSDVTAKQFVATETESRAELKFADSSIVRVGQNSIFSFEAGSRSLSLKEGTMLFYVPHGSGGGNIKTPNFTAAITGTVGKVSKNLIAILKGEVKVNVDGQWYTLREGEVLEVNNHQVRHFKFKPGFASAGMLYNFDGALPGLLDSLSNNGQGGPAGSQIPNNPILNRQVNPTGHFFGRGSSGHGLVPILEG